MVIRELTEIQNLLSGSQRILITAKENAGFDEVGSALAWLHWLKSKRKERVDVALQLTNKNRFKFLPWFDQIREGVQAADYFVIQINVSKTKAQELSYDTQNDMLEIRIKPQAGNFSPRDVSFAQSSFAYDAIISLGAAELSALGPIFENNRELFFNTSIINIDRQSRNVRFGAVNAIYLTATSLAEISYACFGKQISREIATNLYTGLVFATNSFQSPHTTPDTLHLASELIVAGAAREDIVNHLYRTKDMDKLKVWGRILSKLMLVDKRIVYSDLTRDDIAGKDVDLIGLIDDLVLLSPEAHIVLFFFEATPSETDVYAYARENYDLLLLLNRYGTGGSPKQMRFSVKKNKADTEREVIAHLRKQLNLMSH